jgi:hypothetical protein
MLILKNIMIGTKSGFGEIQNMNADFKKYMICIKSGFGEIQKYHISFNINGDRDIIIIININRDSVQSV